METVRKCSTACKSIPDGHAKALCVCVFTRFSRWLSFSASSVCGVIVTCNVKINGKIIHCIEQSLSSH